MTENRQNESTFKKIVNVITFVDLPIRRKFVLFAVGVLFWFVTMFVISIATLVDINTKSNRIVNDVIPHDKIALKIFQKLQGINVDVIELSKSSEAMTVMKKSDLSKARIDDIKSFLSALSLGGLINDYNRNTGRLIESLSVSSVKGYADGEKYVNEMTPLIDALSKRFEEITEVKMQALNRNSKDSEQFEKKSDEVLQLLSGAKMLSSDFSVSAAKLYAVNSQKIRYATRCTSYTVVGVLIVATALLVVFTIWISRSIANPVNSIIKQIRSLGEGEVDLSKRIAITSNDEIGVLSKEFNGLMETVHHMATFKKVIEEDENLEDVYSRIGNVFKVNIKQDEFILYEVSNSQNKMRPVYPLALVDSELLCNDEILHNCDLCRAKKTGHIVSSISYPRVCKQFRTELEKTHVCIPMIVGGSTGGVMQLIFDNKNIDMDDIDRKIFRAEQYIKESVSVIEAKRLMNTLKESALKDSLTGLYNRRFLQEYTETLVAGIQRRGKNMGLIMCDLDYFKQVNDLYGHNVGDMILKETSSIIKKSVREADLVIRFGGEEFLVLLIDINEGDSMKVAEKIRLNLQEAKIKVPDGTIKKTISLGVSEFPADAPSFWQVIKFADVALYRAKETGRNKSVRFTQDMWKEDQF